MSAIVARRSIHPVSPGFAVTLLRYPFLCAFCLDPCGLGIYAYLHFWESLLVCAMRNSAKTVPDLSAALLASMLVDGHVGACGCYIKIFRTSLALLSLALSTEGSSNLHLAPIPRKMVQQS